MTGSQQHCNAAAVYLWQVSVATYAMHIAACQLELRRLQGQRRHPEDAARLQNRTS